MKIKLKLIKMVPVSDREYAGRRGWRNSDVESRGKGEKCRYRKLIGWGHFGNIGSIIKRIAANKIGEKNCLDG